MGKDGEQLPDVTHPERNVKDYSNFRAGDIDPSTGKEISILITAWETHIVYLDKELDVNWSLTENYGEFSPLFGEVCNRVTELEVLSSSSDLPRIQLEGYRSLIGEAIARMLDEDEESVIRDALQRAETYLLERSKESARSWYLTSATGVILASSLFSLILIAVKHIWYPAQGGTETIDVLIAAGMGSLGAYFSVLTRSSDIVMNPAAGRRFHYVDAMARMGVGILGGLFVAVLIKSGQFLPNLATQSPITLIAFSIVAGASERLVPNLIRQLEVSGEIAGSIVGAGGDATKASERRSPGSIQKKKKDNR